VVVVVVVVYLPVRCTVQTNNAGLTWPHCTGVKRVTAEVHDTGHTHTHTHTHTPTQHTHELCKFEIKAWCWNTVVEVRRMVMSLLTDPEFGYVSYGEVNWYYCFWNKCPTGHVTWWHGLWKCNVPPQLAIDCRRLHLVSVSRAGDKTPHSVGD